MRIFISCSSEVSSASVAPKVSLRGDSKQKPDDHSGCDPLDHVPRYPIHVVLRCQAFQGIEVYCAVAFDKSLPYAFQLLAIFDS